MTPYYQDEAVTIYHGDCREVIADLQGGGMPKFDLLLTDPPYGIGIAKRGTVGSMPKPGHKRNGVVAPNTQFVASNWDEKPVDKETLDFLRSVSKHQIIFGGNYFELPPSMGWIVWDKENDGTDFADAELAWTNMDKAVRIKRFMWNGMLQGDMKNKTLREHPTQKPVQVMTFAILFAPKSETILDPFAGSCTTARAAKDLGRKCVAIEREEKYCEIGARRMSQEVLSLQ